VKRNEVSPLWEWFPATIIAAGCRSHKNELDFLGLTNGVQPWHFRGDLKSLLTTKCAKYAKVLDCSLAFSLEAFSLQPSVYLPAESSQAD
jgi:hypothetical protein